MLARSMRSHLRRYEMTSSMLAPCLVEWSWHWWRLAESVCRQSMGGRASSSMWTSVHAQHAQQERAMPRCPAQATAPAVHADAHQHVRPREHERRQLLRRHAQAAQVVKVRRQVRLDPCARTHSAHMRRRLLCGPCCCCAQQPSLQVHRAVSGLTVIEQCGEALDHCRHLRLVKAKLAGQKLQHGRSPVLRAERQQARAAASAREHERRRRRVCAVTSTPAACAGVAAAGGLAAGLAAAVLCVERPAARFSCCCLLLLLPLTASPAPAAPAC